MNKQSNMSKISADIVIVGAGIVGLSLVLLLVKHTDLSVVIVDRASEQDLLSAVETGNLTQRVSAINLLSKQIWQKLGVWDEMAEQAQEYNHMHVWDYFGGKLDFELNNGSSELGYILPNQHMQQVLLKKLREFDQVKLCLGVSCEEIELSYPQPVDKGARHHCPQAVDNLLLQVKNTDGQQVDIAGRYLIAADGANSWVRSKLNIKLSSWSYGHTAIIANVKTEKSHNNTAWQKFTESGPLAFLPLTNNESSIVWSVTDEKSKDLLSKNDQAFMQELGFEFENTLGEILEISPRQSYPLTMRHVKQYLVDNKIIFIGDAAHTVHPLAGQGLNLAMQDVMSLAKIFMAKSKPGTRSLRAFERERKAEVWQMIAGLEMIKRAYSVKSPLLQSLIHFGIKQVDQQVFLKDYLMNIALGKKVTFPD